MPKIMLIDAAQKEETRVAVMDGKRLENFDIESVSKKQLKGNIYLAKVTRVEPSLQAAFVNYGGNRHGFLPFAEIHPDYYRIPVEDRERLLAEQEELRRELQEEAKAREEREIAEAEARANGTAEPEVELTEAEMDAAIEETAATDLPPEDIAPEAEEDPAEAEESDDDQDDEEESEEGDSEDADGEEQSAEGADGETAEGEQAEGQQADGAEGDNGDGKGRRGGRGRGRGGRGRGRNRGRGADRGKPERIVDHREGGREGGEEESEGGMDRLWKRMRRSYKIQEVIKRGQIMLIQVVKEERGNKGAAVTSYITMPGRYCVLMPNSPQSGGVSRKVASHSDRKKMRDMLDDLQVPDGMSVILRTAGVDREPQEVKRDLDYLMRLWDKVRDTTMQSTAPSLIHEEGSLVKRAIRDLYSADIKEIVVEGAEGADTAREVMDMMMPDHVERIRTYSDAVPLFIKYGAEPQIDAIHSNVVTLRSGGYIVINPTEALVSIDINSGRATRERHIEETALKTNLEAAEEVARQLRLRDLGGLVVIDFIDMESRRNNALVEKRIRDALSTDRARVQIGRISTFGLMELSRQRLRPSLTETHFQTCPHCRGSGMLRTTEALALAVVRAIETAGMEGRAGEVQVTVPEAVAMFLFNIKRASLTMLEQRYDIAVVIKIAPVIEDDQGFHVDVTRSRRAERVAGADATVDPDLADEDGDDESVSSDDEPDDGEQQPRHENRAPREPRGDGAREPRSDGARDSRSDGARDSRGDSDSGEGRNGESGEGRNGERGARRRGRRGGRGRNRDGGREGGRGEGRNGDNRGNDRPQNEPGESQPDFNQTVVEDDGSDDIGNRKMDEQGNEFDGNAMGTEQQLRGEGRGRGGRSRGGRGRGRNGGGEGRPQGGGEGRGDRGPRGEGRGGRERGPRNNDDRGNRPQRDPQQVDDNIGNRAPKEETRVAYQSKPRQEDAGSEPRTRDFERVNEVSGDKKKGWWKKLTG